MTKTEVKISKRYLSSLIKSAREGFKAHKQLVKAGRIPRGRIDVSEGILSEIGDAACMARTASTMAATYSEQNKSFESLHERGYKLMSQIYDYVKNTHYIEWPY